MKSPLLNMDDASELLFFDTFSHANCEQLNLDLVQFPQAVTIAEIRIIPLGARVQADFPGGYRLGATNPSAFRLEFFVNDLSNRRACTFQSLGSLDYKQNVEIQFLAPKKISTDGLVLKGLYNAVTIAVYGLLNKEDEKDHLSARQTPPLPQAVQRSQPLDHRQIHETPLDWDRHPRPIEAVSEPPQPIHPRSQAIVEGPRFGEGPPIILPQPESHVQYSAEIPPAYSEPPSTAYNECIPASVPPPSPYPSYDGRFSKPWPTSEERFQPHEENYNQPVYNRPPEAGSYAPPPIPASHTIWDPKDCHASSSEIVRSEHDPYDHKIHSRDKERDRRDKPWERDSHSSEDNSRDRNYKRRERDHRSWECNSPDRYRDRDRDRIKDNSNHDRDRDRNRDAGREKSRSHDNYGDRPRLPSKRPTTPPTPPPLCTKPKTPQTPPEPEKPIGGPRTPKEEEPNESFEEMDVPHTEPYYVSPEQRITEPMYNLSEGEIQEGDNTEDDDGYEEIVSEEEIMSDSEDRTADICDIEYDSTDESWNYMSSFSPYACELGSLQHFTDPTLNSFETLEVKNKNGKAEEVKKENSILEMVKLFDRKPHTEKWVEALESLSVDIIAENLLSIDSKQAYDDAVDTLISWAVEGLNYDQALRQPQPAYKIRHIKAGIRMTSFLFQANPDITDKLINAKIPEFLLQLFDQPSMTLPLKLLILRTLDALTYTLVGYDYILTKVLEFSPPMDFDFYPTQTSKNDAVNEGVCSKTGYQKLLELMLSKQLTRAVASISALLEKIHLYETIQKLKEAIESIASANNQPNETKPASEETPANGGAQPEKQEADIEIANDTIVNPADWEPTIQVIVTCLNDITTKYRMAWKKLTQQKRNLPSNSCFEFQKSPYDPYPGILRLFKESQLLESLSVLFTNSILSNHSAVISSARDLFSELLHSQNGMLYLLTNPEVINNIQKSLLQNIEESREETSDDNIAQNLGIQIACHLQALLYVDSLQKYHSKGLKKEIEDPDIVSILHHMYTMVFTSFGRSALVYVLTLEQNLTALLPFVQMTGDEEVDAKLSKTVCGSYVTEILMICVYFCENISMYENFSEPLFNLSQQEATPKLHDLGPWMLPARKITNYSYEAVPYLASVMKDHLDDASSLPPELISAVKILKYLCVPHHDDEFKELKYVYATIQVFSNDGLAYCLSILQSICDTFLKPSHQSVALVGLQGFLLIGLVKPVISLMKNMLSYLIACRNTEFNDLTAVPVFLQTYSLMLMIPPSSFAFSHAISIQNEIIESLLSYTQPCMGSEESEEALSKSLWTLMVQEILKYAHHSPRTFITGLTVLSELLPLPLPLQTREALFPEEVSKTINHRKLWSAHLHAPSSKIQEIILSLAASTCHPLQQLLRRVCIQLADLAAPTALVIVRAVLDAFMESLESDNKEPIESNVTSSNTQNAPSAETQVIKPCSSSTLRILSLISYLVSHFAFKIPLMSVLKASAKVDEKYAEILTTLLNLLNLQNDKPSHIQSQECIVSIIQSLCDPDIGFVTLENGASVNEVLCCCLPFKEHMVQICSSLIQHIGNPHHNYASVLPSMRTLVMLTEHDYGFYHVKLGLELNSDALRSLFTRISSSFKKDSTDCLSTLSTTLEFLRLMVNGYEEGEQTGRSMLMPSSQLAALLSNQSENSKVKEKEKDDAPSQSFQPLVQLEKYLLDCVSDEDTMESLLESVSSLIVLLNEGTGKDEKPEIKEPTLPAAESLPNQYNSRSVYVIGDVEEERLTPAYWLAIPVAEDTEQEPEFVTTDLVTLAEKYISGEFDLKATIDGLCSTIDSETDLKAKDKSVYGGKRKYSANVNPNTSDNASKRPFIAPMRGRGFLRGGNHSTRANDPFRSRPPNTSRPPSMHVDDFVALETHHNGNSGPSQAKRSENPRGRGRGGFDRNQAFPTIRGGGNNRFFSPPGPYGRRDSDNNRIISGNGRGASRGSNNSWGNRTNSGASKSVIGAAARSNFNNRQSNNERCNYNSPFAQPDLRVNSQRNRDPYSEINLPPNSITVSRYPRVIGSAGPGHWQETRNRAQNQRFMTSTSPGRGSGRRDMNTRHARSFTR